MATFYRVCVMPLGLCLSICPAACSQDTGTRTHSIADHGNSAVAARNTNVRNENWIRIAHDHFSFEMPDRPVYRVKRFADSMPASHMYVLSLPYGENSMFLALTYMNCLDLPQVPQLKNPEVRVKWLANLNNEKADLYKRMAKSDPGDPRIVVGPGPVRVAGESGYGFQKVSKGTDLYSTFRVLYRDGHLFALIVQRATLSPWDGFGDRFFQSLHVGANGGTKLKPNDDKDAFNLGLDPGKGLSKEERANCAKLARQRALEFETGKGVAADPQLALYHRMKAFLFDGKMSRDDALAIREMDLKTVSGLDAAPEQIPSGDDLFPLLDFHRKHYEEMYKYHDRQRYRAQGLR